MSDRFKFRVFISDKKNSKNSLTGMFKVHSLHTGTNKAIITSLYGNCSIKLENNILMQCTGLKDKNGKLIYEGDIVRYAEYEIEEIEPEWEYTEIVWGGSFDYPAFDLKQHNFDNNGLSEIFACGWAIEVVGNIYENKDI